MNSITLISHPSRIWIGGRHLHVQETGRMLAITRDPLRAAAVRLLEEGLATLATVMLIKDADGIAPDVSSTVRAALGDGQPDERAIIDATPANR